MNNKERIKKLEKEHDLGDEDLLELLCTILPGETDALFAAADRVRRQIYGADVFVRGLIEISNICKNDCYYCGIRKSNKSADRYRLTAEEIYECAAQGHELGFRTFVLQGGEDAYYTKTCVENIVSHLKKQFPDCAITLSLGEREREEYECWYRAGADRYLLRHETADETHYARLHPSFMSLSNRKKCLYNLRDIGYQVGAGFMVGSPGQTEDHLLKDLRFLQDLKPHMIGIGPFLSHQDTPFASEKNGSTERTLILLAILRLLFPDVLLPATTALGTAAADGRERGLRAGANVLMPNLSPVGVRKKYDLYDHKICTGEEAAECRNCLEKRVEAAGYRMVTDRGDCRRREYGGKIEKKIPPQP